MYLIIDRHMVLALKTFKNKLFGTINNRKYFIVLVALFLRISIFFIAGLYQPSNNDKIFWSDSPGYQQLALDILQGRVYGCQNMDLSLLRTPGYPTFIAINYFLFGVHPWVVLIVQVIVDSFLGLILYNILFFLAKSNRIALIGGMLWAIEPFAIIYSLRLMSEGLFVFFLVLSFYYFLLYSKQNKRSQIILSSFYLGIATLFRPVSFYMLFFLSVVLFYKTRLFKDLLLFLIPFLLLVSPWVVRNKVVHGHLFYAISQSYNLLVLYAVPIIADKYSITEQEAQTSEESKIAEKYGALYNSDKYLFYKQYTTRAITIIKENPVLFAKQYLRGIIDMFFSLDRESFQRLFVREDLIKFDAVYTFYKYGPLKTIQLIKNNYSPFTILYVFCVGIYIIIVYLFTVLGFIDLCRKHHWRYLVNLGLFGLYLTLINGTAGIGRFKLPIIPFYLIFAAFGIEWLLKRLPSKCAH